MEGRSTRGPNICVWIPAAWKGFCPFTTALLGFSPNNKLTCSNPPPFVSTRAKQPISIIAGATLVSWSTVGTYFPADCHMSLKTKLNLISLFMILICIIYTFSILITFPCPRVTALIADTMAAVSLSGKTADCGGFALEWPFVPNGCRYWFLRYDLFRCVFIHQDDKSFSQIDNDQKDSKYGGHSNYH